MYHTKIKIRSLKNPILIIKAPTLGLCFFEGSVKLRLCAGERWGVRCPTSELLRCKMACGAGKCRNSGVLASDRHFVQGLGPLGFRVYRVQGLA